MAPLGVEVLFSQVRWGRERLRASLVGVWT